MLDIFPFEVIDFGVQIQTNKAEEGVRHVLYVSVTERVTTHLYFHF